MILFMDEVPFNQKPLSNYSYSLRGKKASGYFQQKKTMYMLGVISRYKIENYSFLNRMFCEKDVA